jgi:hypothetical protein
VGYDKFRVWLRQIQGLATTDSGSGRDRFRVWQFAPEIAPPKRREDKRLGASVDNCFVWNCGLKDLYEEQKDLYEEQKDLYEEQKDLYEEQKVPSSLPNYSA